MAKKPPGKAPRKRPRRVTAADKERFLELLGSGHTAASAAVGLGYHPTAFTKRGGRALQAIDPVFKAAYEEAIETGTQMLEREAIRRASEGWDETHVSSRGEEYAVRKYSDTLLIFLLKARRPETYRDNYRVEHTGADGGPLKITFGFVPDPSIVEDEREH